MAAGTHQFIYDATGLPAGVYIYQLQADDKIETKKLIIYK
jgi:hypothetical protein